jgi:hypothetical protein
MRTTLLPALALLGALGACTDVVTPPQHHPASPLPSARRSQVADEGVVPPPACLTRWDFPDLGVQFDCPTTLVDGNPHHYVTTCPVPPAFVDRLPDRDEVELDDAGHIAHEISVYTYPPESNAIGPYNDVVSTYDAAGRLADRLATDGAGKTYSHWVVTERDASGRPLTVSIHQQPLVISDVVYPAIEISEFRYSYDPTGRLIEEQWWLTSLNQLFEDRTIAYDDVGLRRTYAYEFNSTGVIPPGGISHGNQYDLFDDAVNLVEHGSNYPQDVAVYRYDEQGRLVSSIDSREYFPTVTQSFIYDCP